MRNKDFIKEWCNNPSMEGHCGNLWSCYYKLYSYSTCICQYCEGTFHFNVTKYSSTTSMHQHYLEHYLDYYNRNVVLVNNIELNKSKLV